MKIAVIGPGAIGGLAAAYLKLKGEDVSLVGRENSVSRIREKGLEISGARGDFSVKIDIASALSFEPELAIVAVKTQDIEEALKNNLSALKSATILTTQNGVKADAIAARLLPGENIVSSIVMFGSTYLEPGKILHNFEGSWIMARAFSSNDEQLIKISEVLNKAFPVIVAEDITGMKYLKIFVNANNCIAAVLGRSMQETFADPEISSISMAVWKEALGIVEKSGIDLLSLPDFPLERLMKLTALPNKEAAKVYSGIMAGLSKEPLYGSILQSIKRGRPSEIDYINGEFVELAEKNKLDAPLNKKLVEMVHRVEESARFFSREELINNTKGLVN